VQHCFNDTDRGDQRTGRKALSQCHFVHHEISKGLTRDLSRNYAVRGRRLTVWWWWWWCVNKMSLKFKHQTSLTQTRNCGMHRSGISSECYRKQLPLFSSLGRPSLDF
jgi:hypothetical protein